MTSVKQFEHYTDTEIICKIIEGESQLYELLIRRNNSFLYKIGRSYHYTHHDTEDLMQETYIQAFYNLPKFEEKSSFKTWITRIMLNNCYQKNKKFSYINEKSVDEIKHKKNKPMFQNHINTEKKILNKELGHVLENALNKIPEDYRIIFTLRELNGLNVNETSEVTNITETNVKTRLSRAKTMLRAEIEKMYTPEDIFEFNLIYCNNIVKRVMEEIEKR